MCEKEAIIIYVTSMSALSFLSSSLPLFAPYNKDLAVWLTLNAANALTATSALASLLKLFIDANFAVIVIVIVVAVVIALVVAVFIARSFGNTYMHSLCAS